MHGSVTLSEDAGVTSSNRYWIRTTAAVSGADSLTMW